MYGICYSQKNLVIKQKKKNLASDTIPSYKLLIKGVTEILSEMQSIVIVLQWWS